MGQIRVIYGSHMGHLGVIYWSIMGHMGSSRIVKLELRARDDPHTKRGSGGVTFEHIKSNRQMLVFIIIL